MAPAGPFAYLLASFFFFASAVFLAVAVFLASTEVSVVSADHAMVADSATARTDAQAIKRLDFFTIISFVGGW